MTTLDPNMPEHLNRIVLLMEHIIPHDVASSPYAIATKTQLCLDSCELP